MTQQTVTLDPRRHAYRPDLADEALRDRIEAERFVAGEPREIIEPAIPLRGAPDPHASWTTQALYGERVTLFEAFEGWAWVQLASDGYVGYLPEAGLGPCGLPPTHRVSALATSLYFAPNFKAPAVMSLPMNAALRIKGTTGAFGRLADGRFVPLQHIAEPASPARDFVSIAETFAGVPYVWGGKTLQGVDCSGLLQVALQAAGIACPRDSDMQEAELGVPVPRPNDPGGLVRGDLVFWKGHVGIMLDAHRLLHANAHHMAVAIEPLAAAATRIADTGLQIAAIKRLA
ncbi:MAG TPA: NlpC/P60 family protein [Hyphomicrobiaceae bacterium]|nr:NlpC/P60 family protein [Hyphomicrobiaceae bacterium]